MTGSARQIIAAFKEMFHTKPATFFSPGRINLIGEHIDYNDGFVMPAAIDKGIWFAIAANNTDRVHVYSADEKEHLDISLQEIKKADGWKNYILGIIYELQQRNADIHGFDAVFGGNLPIGAGLSSSAAVECGLGFALNAVFGLDILRIDIALAGQKAEHNFPGVKCGIMDQFANMMGKKDHVLLLDCDSLEYELLPLKLTDHSIILINSKVHHALTGGGYNERRQQCEEGLHLLQKKYPSAKTFRDITPEQVLAVKENIPIDVYNRCLYATQEIQRTQLAAQLLKQNKLKEFGDLMFATHEGLSKLYDVSCEELDFLVDEAKRFKEVIGARLMGGGFGGCTINIIENNLLEKITSSITENYKTKFGIDAEIYLMHLEDGTHEICG